MKEYIVVVNGNSETFKMLVNEKLKEGFELAGGVSTQTVNNSLTWYSQAMIREVVDTKHPLLRREE